MELEWIKSTSGTWLPLNTVVLDSVTAAGVYIIWYQGKQGQAGKVVYVGQGDIASRLRSHRQNSRIQAYAAHGLLVSWASVDARYRDGVERYLADTWKPLVGEAHPVTSPIAVKAPWQ